VTVTLLYAVDLNFLSASVDYDLVLVFELDTLSLLADLLDFVLGQLLERLAWDSYDFGLLEADLDRDVDFLETFFVLWADVVATV
jgi:hypothetical protein